MWSARYWAPGYVVIIVVGQGDGANPAPVTLAQVTAITHQLSQRISATLT